MLQDVAGSTMMNGMASTMGTEAILGNLPSLGVDTLGQTTPGFMAGLQGLGQDAMGVLGNENFTNMFDMGLKGFNAYDAHQARGDAKAFQDANLQMAQQAHNRNMQADDRRRSLNF